MSLPQSVVDRTTALLDRLDAEAPGLVNGFYLVGSVALDDYWDGVSDIDFVAVTDAPFPESVRPILARVHDGLAADGTASLDGIYVDDAMLKAWPVTPSNVPFSIDGRLTAKPCFETNPATWLCLAQNGVPLRGPDVGCLAIPQDADRLRHFLVGNLQTYWRDWIDEARLAIAQRGPEGDGNAAAVSWGVLGTARIACTIATGRIVSKSAAGIWARCTFPSTPKQVIDDALATRHRELARLPCARFEPAFAFMDALIAREEQALGETWCGR